MRVADKMNYNQSLGNIQKNRSDMATYQNQAASQKRINKPSDDPLGAARILENRMQIKGFEQYKRNILSAKEFIEFSEQSLGQASELLIRAKELALSQSNDASGGADTRRIVATEVRQLYEQLVGIANQRYGERYVFGGFKSTELPFDMQGQYYGDDNQIEVQVDRNSYMAMNLPGSVIFMGRKQAELQQMQQALETNSQEEVPVRGLNSVDAGANSVPAAKAPGHWGPKSVNIFETLTNLEFGLRANNKMMIQDTLEELDNSLSQVNMARGELGSRMSALNTGYETLQKLNIDTKAIQSEIEDVDMFELVNNLSRTESQLEATLATSAKLTQKSLLDFLR